MRTSYIMQKIAANKFKVNDSSFLIYPGEVLLRSAASKHLSGLNERIYCVSTDGDETVHFIGIGAMRETMAASLARSDEPLVIRNHKPAKCARLANAGVRVDKTPSRARYDFCHMPLRRLR